MKDRLTSFVTSQLDYIYAEGRIMVVHVTENGIGCLYNVLTDHLGSWEKVMDESKNTFQQTHFDPWGNRMSNTAWNTPQTQTTFSFDRGFTGYEHYDILGIINANARLYDPVIGRFFSPDPFVQMPDYTQSYNRYSYCLNNPVMYSDPDGRFSWLAPIITNATLFGVGNLIAHSIRGDIQSFGDGLKFFGQDATVGAALGGIWKFSPILFNGGEALQATMAVYAFEQFKTGLFGTMTGCFNGGWKGVKNGAELFLGNFYVDENNWWGGVAQGVLRHSWEMPQSFLGHVFSQARNTIGNVSRVDYLGGATFATKEESKHKMGVTIGQYSNIWIHNNIIVFNDYLNDEQLYMHEYGHTFQSRNWGPLYLFSIGLPSLISASLVQNIPNDSYNATTHDYFWPEYHANRYAAKYFNRYYNHIWNEFMGYPLNDYRP